MTDPLYLPDRQIAARLLGRHAGEWPVYIAAWERAGMPAADPVTGLRYWPAIRAWFDLRHGLGGEACVSLVPDGVEDFDGTRARTEIKAAR